MKRIRASAPRIRRERRWPEDLPADPRDPDVVRAKALARQPTALAAMTPPGPASADGWGFSPVLGLARGRPDTGARPSSISHSSLILVWVGAYELDGFTEVSRRQRSFPPKRQDARRSAERSAPNRMNRVQHSTGWHCCPPLVLSRREHLVAILAERSHRQQPESG